MYKWITKDVVLAIHKMQILEHGGDYGIRDMGLLESAITRPINKYDYEQADICALASSYAYGIIKNHPFIDGNKRTSLVVCLLFLNLNGYTFKLNQEELYHLFISLAESKISENEFAEILRNKTAKIDI